MKSSRLLYCNLLFLLIMMLVPSSTMSSSTSSSSTLILMDVDNTLYRESQVGIESQIIANTHSYCQNVLGIKKEDADELYETYGSTIEGLKQTIWKNLSTNQVKENLYKFYHHVYDDIDMSNLLPERRRRRNLAGQQEEQRQEDDEREKEGGMSTGYSHADSADMKLLCKLISSCPYPICMASNSPSWHVQKVLKSIGLSSKVAVMSSSSSSITKNRNTKKSITQNNDENLICFTPDRLSDKLYPTKYNPIDFFSVDDDNVSDSDNENAGTNTDTHFFDPFHRIIILDDSKQNLKKISDYFIGNEKSKKEIIAIQINKKDNDNENDNSSSLTNALLCTLGLIDPLFEFSQVKYLQSKNKVDQQSIHVETWNTVMSELDTIINNNKKNKKKGKNNNDDSKNYNPIRIVDLGAGLLSMLDLMLHGDSQRGMKHLQQKHHHHCHIEYTAYESNVALSNACHQRLISWGFKKMGNEASEDPNKVVEYTKQNIRVRLIMDDFDTDDGTDDNMGWEGKAPHLIIGCCFADLLQPDHLVPSMIKKFHLLDATANTLVYFPITFCGTTQFLPPRPFEKVPTDGTDSNNGNKSTKIDQRTIPSDTEAFRLYSEALEETLRHNLDQRVLQSTMEDYGATLIGKGPSDWHIDPQNHSYLFDTMLYFFGATGGPQVMADGWDATGWIQRAKQRRPKIQVSNTDFLFRFQQHVDENKEQQQQQEKNSSKRSGKLKEILFTDVEKVTTVEKTIPVLGPSQVLIESAYSLISSGTELKIFKGLFDDAALDVNIKGMDEERMAYPLSYGYCSVGRIVQCGSDVPVEEYQGRLVFTFSPHSSHVIVDVRQPGSFQFVPDGISARDAIFMPSVETALSIVHDAHVRVGENVAVFGQGLIGLLVTAILCTTQNRINRISSNFGCITTFDTIPDRLATSAQMGASQALFPGTSVEHNTFDVAIEVSGNGRALQAAIDNTCNGGRVIVGSWYGNKDISLKLGIDFHRSHKTIQTSQVSEIPASLSTLWTKKRRFDLTWDLVRQIQPSRLVTKTMSLADAQQAYEALASGKEIAVAFEY